MVLDFFTYRRPDSVHSSDSGGSWSSIDWDKLRQKQIAGIPAKLSFDRIVNGEVCFPCRTIDFMNYLRYIEHDAENLRFYLWYKDYVKRFDALPAAEKALSPPWQPNAAPNLRVNDGAGDDRLCRWGSAPPSAYLPPVRKVPSPAPGGPRVPASVVIASDDKLNLLVRPSQDTYDPSKHGDFSIPDQHTSMIESSTAFNDPVDLKPFSVHPFRDEVNHIAVLFLSSSSQYELNLSSRDRMATLHALRNTTHPSAFAPAFASVESALRLQSHPNFIRHTVSNSNEGRNAAMRYGGIVLMILSIIGAIILALGTNNRGWRVAPPAMVFGVGLGMHLNGRRRVCFVLWSARVRDRAPWEGADAKDISSPFEKKDVGDVEKNAVEFTPPEDKRTSYIPPLKQSFSGSSSYAAKLGYHTRSASVSSSYASFAPPDDELIDPKGAERVEKYKKRNMVTHLFGHTGRLGGVDPEVNRLHTLIVMQNFSIGLASMGIMALILAFLPRGAYF